MNFNTLKQFRQQVYQSFEHSADALFDLCDALLSESQARSLPELSQSPFFSRKWPSLYQALQDGQINVAALREAGITMLLNQWKPNEPVWISLDRSNIARPEAATSADRGIIHVSNLPRCSKPISVGWQFSTVMLLPEEPNSWVGLLAQQRIATHCTAIEVAILQLNQVVPLRLARELGQANYRPWERTQRAITPGQLRRQMGSILLQVGTPVRSCQPRGKSPGRAHGFHPKPAPRYRVVLKSKKKGASKGS